MMVVMVVVVAAKAAEKRVDDGGDTGVESGDKCCHKAKRATTAPQEWIIVRAVSSSVMVVTHLNTVNKNTPDFKNQSICRID